jgi:hypothetical protein
MYTIFSAVLLQQRKSDAMTSFGHTTRSAIYYKPGPHWCMFSVFGLAGCRTSGINFGLVGLFAFLASESSDWRVVRPIW